jgi:hypothetical protein
MVPVLVGFLNGKRVDLDEEVRGLVSVSVGSVWRVLAPFRFRLSPLDRVSRGAGVERWLWFILRVTPAQV